MVAGPVSSGGVALRPLLSTEVPSSDGQLAGQGRSVSGCASGTGRADDAGRRARIEQAGREEQAAVVRLRQLIHAGDVSLEEAARRLARFDVMVASIVALLRRDGYIG